MTFIEEIDKKIAGLESDIRVCKALGMDALAEKMSFGIVSLNQAKRIYLEVESKKENP